MGFLGEFGKNLSILAEKKNRARAPSVNDFNNQYNEGFQGFRARVYDHRVQHTEISDPIWSFRVVRAKFRLSALYGS